MIDAEFEPNESIDCAAELVVPKEVVAYFELVVPKEVVAYFEQYKCLVCDSPLSDEPFGIRDAGRYTAFADCAEDAMHFEVSVSWKDPKIILLNHIEIVFEYEKRQYKIRQRHDRNKIVNEVTSNTLNDEGDIADDSPEYFAELTEPKFDFKKFSKKAFANRIRMLMVFT